MNKLLVLFFIPILTFCWWDVGHMLTAAIAETRLNQLDPFASAHFKDLVTSINQLCDNKSRTLIESACWPDDLKSSQYNMKLFDPWHFKDGPYVTDAVVPVINYTEGAVSSIEVMKQASSVLKVNILKNTAERALFARYVVHLVGDIHQPLHSVALFNLTYPKGDLGGNAFKVILLNGSTSNFHSFWDAGAFLLQNDTWFMSRPLNMQNLTALKQVANGMIRQYGAEVEQLGKIIDPIVWAQQSYKIAQNTTYPYIANTNKLNQEYTNLAYQTAKKRITLAGYRLANYVISIYKTALKHKYLEREELVEKQLSNDELWAYLAQDSIKCNKGQNKKSQI